MDKKHDSSGLGQEEEASVMFRFIEDILGY